MVLKYYKIYHRKAIRKSREEINEIENRKTIEKSTMLRLGGFFFKDQQNWETSTLTKKKREKTQIK